MRKKSKNKVRSVSSMSFGDISIDILFLLRDDGKSLPYEFVCDSDHGELARLSSFSEPCVSLLALGVEAACRPSRDIEESSGVGISVTVDVPSYIDRCSGLFVSWTQPEVSGDLLGVLEVSKASCSDYERRGECYSYALDGSEECELTAELVSDKFSKFLLEPRKPLVNAHDRLADRVDRPLVQDGKAFNGALEVGQGRPLLLELPHHRPLLFESQDGFALHFEWGRGHLLPVKGYEPGIEDICLDNGEHGPSEVFYLERVLHADCYPGGVEQIEQHRAVVSGGLHDAVDVRDAGDGSDELLYSCCGVVECACLAAFVRGIGSDERRLADINSNVLHNNVTLTVNGIYYIVSLHCECGVICPTNYPVSDVKSVWLEHNYRSARPMKTLAYSTLR